MSEEEKKAKEYIKEFKNEVFEGVGNKSIMAKNIDILLNLIEKLQKEIKHQKQQRKYWRDNFYEQQEEIEVLKEDLDKKVKALDIAMSNPDYISKDKIREIIAEYIKQLQSADTERTAIMLSNFIMVLNDLLEEN